MSFSIAAMLRSDGYVCLYLLRSTEEVTIPGMAPPDQIIAHVLLTRTEAFDLAVELNRLSNTDISPGK